MTEKTKEIKIFSYYLEDKTLIITIEETKFIFKFEETATEETVKRLTLLAINKLNKYKFQQLEIKPKEKQNG